MTDIGPHDDLLIYLRTLAGTPKPAQCFDVRWKTLTGAMHRRFVSAPCIDEIARLITRMASWTDVYVGVALREGSTGGSKRAIDGSRLLHVDCDDSGATQSMTALVPPPTMVVASGTPGHSQMYWLLDRSAVAGYVESANRRLALALGGDSACVDIARILRPPTTFNYKADWRRPVMLIAYRPQAQYTLDEAVAGLPEPRSPKRVNSELPLIGRRTAEDRSCWRSPQRTTFGYSADGSRTGQKRSPARFMTTGLQVCRCTRGVLEPLEDAYDPLVTPTGGVILLRSFLQVLLRVVEDFLSGAGIV
jgi:hypothetical protein